MAVDTFYAATSDGALESKDGVYANARAGTGTLAVHGSTDRLYAGQWYSSGFYYVYEAFLEFDTSALPDDATVAAVSLDLWPLVDYSTTDFTIRAYLRDWGGTLAAGDFVAGADLAALTLLATYNTASGFAAGSYKSMASEAAFAAAVNLTGATRILLASSRTLAGDTPSGLEMVGPESANNTNKPRLVVTTGEAPAATPDLFLDGLWG